MAGIELADVTASELLHEAADRTDGWRRYQQVDMVVHQHVGVQLAARIEQCLTQQREVTLPIVIVQKAWQAITGKRPAVSS